MSAIPVPSRSARSLVFLLLLGACLVLPCSDAAPLGGTGWLTINCDVDGASVYLDNTLKGTISGGSFDVADGSQYSTYTVKKEGYYDATGEVAFLPGGDPNLEITVTLTQKPVGSGKGWIKVSCNLDGATVAFDGVAKGTTAGGSFTQEVSITGTPYTSYSVSKAGYVTYTGTVSSMPADGQTITLYATLNPVPTTTVPTSVPTTTPATTATTVAPPIGGDEGWYKVTCNVNGASVSFNSEYKGAISGGSLSVPVYSTGTPYTTYRVEKAGYVTASGQMPAAPAKGKTVTLAVTLVPVATSQPTPLPTTQVSPLGSGKGYIAIHANVDGATVTIGSHPAGIITNGVLKVPVSTTGTPFSSFTITKAGYVTATGTIPRQPAEGETVDVYVTLAEEKTPTPTESPLPPALALAGLTIAALALAIRKGQ